MCVTLLVAGTSNGKEFGSRTCGSGWFDLVVYVTRLYVGRTAVQALQFCSTSRVCMSVLPLSLTRNLDPAPAVQGSFDQPSTFALRHASVCRSYQRQGIWIPHLRFRVDQPSTLPSVTRLPSNCCRLTCFMLPSAMAPWRHGQKINVHRPSRRRDLLLGAYLSSNSPIFLSSLVLCCFLPVSIVCCFLPVSYRLLFLAGFLSLLFLDGF
jgi:hypothetical protein